MGITGLLPFVKNACRPANIRDFKGSTVAIDGYSWLHKGAFSCADKLVKGEKTDGYVYYCIKQLNMLLDAGVKPIMVFDGCNLESKAVTEKKRRENREKTKQKGKELLCEGKVKEARECFQRCVDVTPEMAMDVIQACHKKNVDCIVAPYEADAQLAYLNKEKIADIIITEDSDLILFGCDNILFKMDSFGGGLLFEKQNLANAFGKHAMKMSFEKFRYMCILSGCDYLPSLSGIGLAKAFKFFTLTNNLDLEQVLTKIPSYLRMPNLVVSQEYIKDFIKSNNTFLYQLVFCPRKKSLVPLNPYPDNINSSEMEYAGKYFSDDLAYQFALGKISVRELKALKSSTNTQHLTLSSPSISHTSILWGTGNEPQANASQTPKTFIKFTSNPIKICTKKRLHEENGNETKISESEIFSDYFPENPPSKKVKVDSPIKDTSEEQPVDVHTTPHTAFIPFRKTLTTNSSNISKNLANLRKIVRSRFFVTREEVLNSAKHSPCIDSIDSEYQDTSVKSSNEEECDSGIVDDDCDITHYYNSSGKENVNQSSILDSVDNTEIEEAISDDNEMNSFNISSTSLEENEHLNDSHLSSKSIQNDRILNKFSFKSSSSSKKKNTNTKCRTIGLSKKQQPKTGKTIEDTLFNFKFTKIPKSATST